MAKYKPPRISEIETRPQPRTRTYGDHLHQKPFQTQISMESPRLMGTIRYMDMRLAYLLSMVTHVTAPIALVFFLVVLAFLGLIDFDLFHKQAKPKPKDIEFVLLPKTTPEQTPIDPNTNLRADRNSRAGGESDPTRHVNIVEPVRQVAAAQPQAPSQPQEIVIKPAPVVEPPRKQPTPTPPKAVSRPEHPAPLPLARPIEPSNQISNEPIIKESLAQATAPLPSMMQGSLQSSASSASSSSASELANGAPGNKNGPLGVDAIQQPDFGPYMSELKRRIKQSWKPPRGNESKRVVLHFTVDRSGKLKDVQVTQTSGEPSADQAAITAIKNIFPFRPLPKEFAEEDIGIEFTFDYNVFGNKDRLSRYSG